MNELMIDTSDNKKTIVELLIDGKAYSISSKKTRSSNLLPLILKLLKKHDLGLSEIKKIRVNRGPGSFTGIRVGVSVANTIAAVLNIPINGKKVGELVEPKYT